MKIIYVLICFFLPISFIYAAEKSIILNIAPQGYPPYMIKNKQGKATGIMVDVLESIAKKQGYHVETLGIPKKRVFNYLLLGKIDATPNAKEWVHNANGYAFTDIIVVARDVLFSRKESSLMFDKTEDLFGKKLGVHLGYIYPSLEPFFHDGRIKKTEAISEKAMLRATLVKRNDASVMNDLVGQWTIKQNLEMQNKFASTGKSVNEFDYRIMFSKKWQFFVDIFNDELALMKQNGELEQILEKYK